MGRKNLSELRQDQILDAFITCILRYGIEGTSISKVAAVSGISRTLIYHYVSSKEELVDKLVEQMRKAMLTREPCVADVVTDDLQIAKVLDFYFPEHNELMDDENALHAIMLSSPDDYPQIADLFTDIYNKWVADISDIFKRLFPQCTMQQCKTLSYTLLALSIGDDSLRNQKITRHVNIKKQASLIIDSYK